MKKIFLSPFFAGFFVVSCLLIYYVASYICRAKFGPFNIEKIGVTEVLTYVFYGISGVVLVCVYNDYLHTPRQKTYFAFIFLWLTALLREMGAQHWLAVNDTTAIKLKYFKNAAVPMYSKIFVGILIFLVISAIAYLVFKYCKRTIVGFFKFQTIYWTIATFGVLGILTQLTDRLPSKYHKWTGEHLSEPVKFVSTIFEEGGESLLPLVFMIGLLQFHLILRKTTFRSVDESKDIVPDSV